MPALSQMITWTLLQAPGWDRDGEKGLLPLFNEVYNIFVRSEVEQTIHVSNGELPSIDTENDVYSYDIPTTIWRVTNVGLKNAIAGDSANYGLSNNRQMPDQTFYFAGREYARYQQVRLFDKTKNNPARIEFMQNPGETTSTFLYIGHLEPSPQLTSETLEPDLPEEAHAYLMQGVLKLVESLQNGNYTESYQYIYDVLKPKARDTMNSGDQGYSNHVQRREF